ncbi:TenA family protein [Pediococcus pentosaceus]|uniref:TenA family protein n=1 Tax=Pediococcus pentosaceus TaxID=1255 RepID=UPI003982055C
MQIHERLQEVSTPILRDILTTPFLQGLQAGTLPQRVRNNYVYQDDYYLEQFEAATALIEARLPDWLLCQRPQIVFEDLAHQALAPSENVGPVSINQDNQTYVTFLLAQAKRPDPMCGVLALLPCTESYYLIAKTLEHTRTGTYQGWLDFYRGADYHHLVTWYWQIVDTLYSSAQIEANWDVYCAIYQRAYQAEYDFWLAAWPEGAQDSADKKRIES